MPGTGCAVYGCANTWIKTRGTNIAYHSFPVKQESLKKKWIARCNRHEKDILNPYMRRVCSDHFTEDDYERDLRNELLGLPLRRLLKKTAVPTQNLYCDDVARNQRVVKKYRKEMTDSDASHSSCNSDSNSQCSADLDSSYKSKYEDILEKYNKLLVNYSEIRWDYKKHILSLNDELQQYKDKCKALQKTVKLKDDLLRQVAEEQTQILIVS